MRINPVTSAEQLGKESSFSITNYEDGMNLGCHRPLLEGAAEKKANRELRDGEGSKPADLV